MATMIPETIPFDAPRSERRVFELLRDDPAADRWVVMHSIRPRLDNLSSGWGREVDFLMLIPNRGALCLEVKGGHFDIRDGQWFHTGNHETVEPPVRQSEKAMFDLRNELRNNFRRRQDDIKYLPIGFAVAFTDWVWPDHLRRPAPLIYDNVVLDASGVFVRQLATDTADLGNPIISGLRPKPPTVDTIERLVNYLAPNVMTLVTVGPKLDRIDDKLNILTEEQHAVLDIASENDRCLVKGAAGTGKTMLALEYARRAAKSGHRVGLLCFNVLLGNFLKEQTKADAGITAGAFWPHIIRPLILSSPYAGQFLHDEESVADEGALYSNIYPFYSELALTGAGPQFDVLVVDETPDMCHSPYLELMDLLLTDGLSGGRWAMFGDFSNQAIFPGSASDPESSLLRYFKYPARLNLTVNCRNTSSIARDTARISGSDIPKTRPIDGPNPKYRYWRNAASLSNLLDEEVRRLLTEGVSIDDIMVLSERRLENTGLDTNRAYGGYHLETYSRGQRIVCGGDDEASCLKFCSIPAFKGMESQVVILILDRLGQHSNEIDREMDREFDGPNADSYAYIGMSRARGALVVLANSALRKELEDRLAS